MGLLVADLAVVTQVEGLTLLHGVDGDGEFGDDELPIFLSPSPPLSLYYRVTQLRSQHVKVHTWRCLNKIAPLSLCSRQALA